VIGNAIAGRNSVRIHTLLLTIVATSCLAFACTSVKSNVPVAGPTPAYSTQEIMLSLVGPPADTVWNAVTVSATEKGIEMTAPQNDEEWKRVRHAAVTLSEAMNLIVMEGRKVGTPGAPAKDPNAELGPEQIEALIAQDRESWMKFARSLQDSVAPAIKAIDEKNADALSKAGEGLSAACEACHKKFWYPNNVKQ